MKSIIKFMVIGLFTLAANAQKITEKDLLGQWKIISITEPDMQLDFTANTSKITEKFIADNPQHTLGQLQEMANDRLDYLQESYLIFAPNFILLLTNKNEEPAHFKYSFVTKGDTQYLVYNGTGDIEEIYIRGGLLYKSFITGEISYTEVYQKQKT